MPGPEKWHVDMIFIAYDMAKAGSSESRIADGLGVSRPTLRKWRTVHPLLDLAIRRGSRNLGKHSTGSFIKYCYGRLPDKLKSLWDEINAFGHNASQTKLESLLKDKGKRVRQQLFIHALVASNFNPSEACRKIGIDYSTVYEWEIREPEFGRLMKEIHFHKKNFFEGALVNLVAQGDSAATIFANRTLNRDRGYDSKIQVEHNHKHQHAMVNIESLDLPIEVRKLILDKIREAQAKALPAAKSEDDVIDAEIVKRVKEEADLEDDDDE